MGDDYRTASIIPIFKKGKKSWELQARQPHFGVWENRGASPPGSHFWAYEGEECDWKWSAGIYHGLPTRLPSLMKLLALWMKGEQWILYVLQIWDTAGQERFRTITQSYYRSANGAILAYDISKRGSFQSIPRWIEDVRKYAGSNIVQLLIGNKSDLSDLREVQLEEAQSLAEHYDIICAIETSAKDSSNVEEAFVKMATELMMRHGGPMFSEKSTDSIKLDSKDVVEGWGCGC
nr:PREDICTED: ras-related protein Rab-43 [Struthio camelus australis]